MGYSVKEIQRMLKAAGYNPGTVDGIAGPKTKAAIKKFQKKNGLTVDGIVGEKTWAALCKKSKKKSKEKLSAHFTRSEFKCECGGKYCDGYPAEISTQLVKNLEKVRSHFGKPITITSGLRCSKYNASLTGSASNSRHKSGKAADIYIPGVSQAAIKKYWYTLPKANYCYYGTANMGNAVHVDVK